MELADSLGLTEKQRLFAEAIAADPDRNQTKAAETAGYDAGSAHVRGSELVRNSKVQEYIAALTKTATDLAERKTARKIMSLAEALGRMTELAESDMSDFVTVVDGEARPDVARALEAGKGHLIQEFAIDDEIGKEGQLSRIKTKFKLYDKKDALDKIIRHHGGYKEGADANPGQTIINVLAVLGALPQDTLKQIREAMAQKVLTSGE